MKIKSIHFQAIIFAVIYYILSGLFFLRLVTFQNFYISFLGPIIFGIVSAVIFFYLFSHKDFFPFWKKFQKEESNIEKNYLDEFKNYGKLLACVIISEVAGPIFLSLTVLFLFPKSANRYLIVVVSTILSTIFAVALAKGIIHLVV